MTLRSERAVRRARVIARSVIRARRGVSLRIHGRRDRCMWCYIKGTLLLDEARGNLPRRRLADEAWTAKHIMRPAERMHARALDRYLAEKAAQEGRDA